MSRLRSSLRPVDDGGHGAGQRAVVGPPRDLETREVADVLADGELAVHGLPVGSLGRERVVLADERAGELLEGLAIRLGPPVGELALAVVARALIVEAVPDLVADDRADRAEVRGGVPRGVEEWGLEDGGREHDLVHARVVVRVHRLRGHEPLIAVDRLADLAELAAELELGDAPRVAEQVARVDGERRVVAPLHGVADLRGELRELLERALAGIRPHPGEARDRVAIGLDEMADELVHRGLRVLVEVALDVEPAHGLAHRALHERDAAAPALALLGRARERGAVEVKVRARDLLRQERGGAPHDLPDEPGPPRLELILDQQRREARERLGLGCDDLGECGLGRAQRGEVGLPVEAGSDLLEPCEVAQVVELLDVATRDGVPVRCGDAHLEVVGERREVLGLALGDADEPQHAGDVRAVLLADLGELLLAVVRLVGKADAALHDEHDVARGVSRVVVDEHAVEAAQALALELADRAHELRDRRDGERALELGGDRSRTERVDALHVHEARVERRNLVGLGVGPACDEPRRGGVARRDDVAHRLLGVLGEHRERAVAGLVCGDLRALDPPPVHMAEQIVLRTHRGVELGDVDA